MDSGYGEERGPVPLDRSRPLAGSLEALMPDLLIVQLGPLPFGLLDHLASRAPASVRPLRPHLDPAFAHDPQRDQYLASALLDHLARFPAARVLGVTAVDLFNPILTFVFGEAHLPGRAAVFSIHRLQEEFYGLPPNRELLFARAVKEMLHELGHTHGLTHCPDASCVMSSSHSVEGVDGKQEILCRRCALRLPTSVWRPIRPPESGARFPKDHA